MASRRLLDIDELARLLDDMPRSTKLDLIQMVIDLGGIADPSGVADGASAIISLIRGDLLGAAISVASILPFGDLAKAAKLPKYAKSLKSVVKFARRRPEIAFAMLKPLRQIDDLLTQVRRLALKAGSSGQAIVGQLDDMRTIIREFTRRVVSIEKFGAAKIARKNGRIVDAPTGAYVDPSIRGSRITLNEAVDIIEDAASKGVANREMKTLLEQMALADKWELRAHIHRSPTSEMNRHFNISIDDGPQIHITLDKRGNFFRASQGRAPDYLTPKLGTQAR